MAGLWCQRLDPSWASPPAEVMGELTLFTEPLQLGVVHLADRVGEGGGEDVTTPSRC